MAPRGRRNKNLKVSNLNGKLDDSISNTIEEVILGASPGCEASPITIVNSPAKSDDDFEETPSFRRNAKKSLLVDTIDITSEEMSVSSHKNSVSDLSDFGRLSEHECDGPAKSENLVVSPSKRRKNVKKSLPFDTVEVPSNLQRNTIFDFADLEDLSSDSEEELVVEPLTVCTLKSRHQVDDDLKKLLNSGAPPRKKVLSSDEDEDFSYTFDRPVVKRGLTLTPDVEEAIHSSEVLPEAAIFQSSIERYREAMKNSKQNIKLMKKKEEEARINADKEKADKERKKQEEKVMPASLRHKLAQIKRNFKEDREQTRRLCESVLSHRRSDDNDDNDDDGSEVLEVKEEEEEISVKIRCRREVMRITMKKGEKFAKVFPEIAEKCSTRVSGMSLFLRDHAVELEDTPLKLNVQVTDILKCFFHNSSSSEKMDQNNYITIKLQSNKSKVKSLYEIHKLEPFSVLMKKYAEDNSLPDNIIFDFDGERIDPRQNSIELDLENDCVIDVKIP